MRIGILSDSHGRIQKVRQALVRLELRGIDLLVHCGDIGNLDVLELFVGKDFRFVWGNCDQPTPAILAFLRATGLSPPPEPPLRFDADGAGIAVFHGHEPGFTRALHHPGVDYLFHGHTHVRRDERRGGCRIINPGALHRASPPSAAWLDTRTDQLVFEDLP
jgi:putative phosphoesterase